MDDLTFSGEIWFWKGPAPRFFVPVPDEECAELEGAAAFVTDGWGMVPVTARIGNSEWRTSLFPKDDRYLVPLKAKGRETEALEAGDSVRVRLGVDL